MVWRRLALPALVLAVGCGSPEVAIDLEVRRDATRPLRELAVVDGAVSVRDVEWDDDGLCALLTCDLELSVDHRRLVELHAVRVLDAPIADHYVGSGGEQFRVYTITVARDDRAMSTFFSDDNLDADPLYPPIPEELNLVRELVLELAADTIADGRCTREPMLECDALLE